MCTQRTVVTTYRSPLIEMAMHVAGAIELEGRDGEKG